MRETNGGVLVARFDNGISWYTVGSVSLKIAFPEDDIKCKWCPHLRADEANGRHFCRLTGSVLYSINILADDCPIDSFVETKKENKDV